MERIPFRGATLQRLDLDAVASAPERLAPPTARRIVHRLNKARRVEARQAVPGELLALSLLHEVAHRAILAASRQRPSIGMGPTLESVRGAVGAKRTDRLLGRFATDFPGVGEVPPGRLEDLLLVSLARDNPAASPLHDLVDTSGLSAPDLTATLAAVERHYGSESFDDGPSGETRSLLDILRDPARHSPNSLIGQLRYVRDHWGWLLGDAFAELLGELDLAIGILTEEEAGLHRRFGGGGGPVRSEAQLPSFVGAAEEPEAFSSDSAWMPRLVLMAKSTYVWLDQLSRRYGRPIHTLDAIPDEELEILAGWGVSGLWLIGLWERSVASERIKRMRGNHEAVASAYSLDDYRIAEDIGGEAAYATLRDGAWAHGIRLASDMVPNHMGIDSRWVIDHPEWFLSVTEPPYPAYTYGSADLSPDERVGVVLEDHYWNDSDAAVTFKRFDRWSGDERYIYHGNDGTSFPWNDTAQLDFLNPEVREHVIQVILDVARRFPVIRFDAAMVLAKKHIQRLWWPLPGSGDAIPSRAQYAMSQADFDARMPLEFWREV
ncbi:MAG: alpha-amylase family glycosyl hydrolase, partial [Candidatus Limnocylindrales bacterium]